MRRGRVARRGAFRSVILAYLAYLDEEVDGGRVQESTRQNYRRELELIASGPCGGIPASEMRPALVQAHLDGLRDHPGKQQISRTALSALQKWALVRDMLPYPITTGTQIIGIQGGHTPWTDEQVTYGEQHAKPLMSRIVTLMANTGQRGSDIVRMRWSDVEDYQGRPGINVTQQKTGVQLWVPFTQELIARMATWQRAPTFLVLNRDGTQLTRPEISNLWRRELGRREIMAPLKGLVLHGLRGTAVQRLRRAGASTGQICDCVGMSPKMIERYLRFSVKRDNALAAVISLEAARERKRDSGPQ